MDQYVTSLQLKLFFSWKSDHVSRAQRIQSCSIRSFFSSISWNAYSCYDMKLYILFLKTHHCNKYLSLLKKTSFTLKEKHYFMKLFFFFAKYFYFNIYFIFIIMFWFRIIYNDILIVNNFYQSNENAVDESYNTLKFFLK